jgi:hypothetical protein
MRFLSEKGLIAAAAMLVFAGTAAATPPGQSIGTLTCTTVPGETIATSTVTSQVSSYAVGVQNVPNVGGGSTGSGGGKVTFTADLHISLSKFTAFLPLAEAGMAFQQCTLVATAGNGVMATYTFQMVAISSVTAVAAGGNGSNTTAYTDLQLQYGALTVSMTNPDDDGGTEPTK